MLELQVVASKSPKPESASRDFESIFIFVVKDYMNLELNSKALASYSLSLSSNFNYVHQVCLRNMFLGI